MPSGVSVHGQTFLRGRHLVGQGRFQGNPGAYGRFRNDMHDDHRVRG